MPKKRVTKTWAMSSNIAQKENKQQQSRKRKASGSPSGAPPSKSTWGMDTEQTQILIKSIRGVDYISESNGDSCNLSETTPAVFSNTENSQGSNSSSFHLPPVPGAPRILLNSQRDNVTSGSDDSSENSFGTPASHTTKHVQIVPQPLLHLGRVNLSKHAKTIAKKDKSQCDPFITLSDEMMLYIFGLVPRFTLAKCARVCKRWSRLVLDESLWRRTDLSSKTLSPGVLGHVLNRGVWALRLSKTEIEAPIFTGVASPIQCTRLSKVQYLDLSMAGASPEVLEQILSICKDIRKLSLERLELNDTVCTYIGENRDLEVLNLAMCQGITANGLMPILSNCSRLESLNIAWTSLHRHSVVYLCLCLPRNLLYLNISGCRENISDDEVLQLSKTCPYLIELDLSDCTALTNTTIGHIVKNLKHIEHLSLSRCYHIVPTTIYELNQISSLYAINVFGCVGDAAMEIVKGELQGLEVNKYQFSTVSRPTTGIRRTSIWGVRTRDNIV